MLLDLDANATYAPSDSMLEVIRASLSRLGNPSSIHRGGQKAKAAIEQAREHVRQLVGARHRDTIIFTSGATEANNWVISAFAQPGSLVVSSMIEHPCILAPLRLASEGGVSVALVAPNADGEVTSEAVVARVEPSTTLVSVMAANNETGVVNNIRTIATRIRHCAPRAVIHTDAAQIIGKMSFRFDSLELDCLTVSGHKFGALSGTGVLVVREGLSVSPILLGGPQESKLRGGTENVLGIISLGAAASEVIKQGADRGRSMQTVRDTFEAELSRLLPECEINGRLAPRLPNTTSVWIPRIRADDLLVALDLEGIYISSGAACSSGKPEPSHVLCRMGQAEERARSTVRVSFRADHDDSVGTSAAQVMARVVKRMRRSGS